MSFEHIPVLLDEVIENMNIKPNGIYVDGTMGGGGHSIEIAKRMMNTGVLVGIDQDTEAIEASKQKLSDYKDNLQIVHNNFKNISSVIKNLGYDYVDGILLDIGVSSHQIDKDERGFSYMNDGPLDMRMNKSSGVTASDILNNMPQKELSRIIKEYGEERWAERISKFICEERNINGLSTTSQLVEIIKKAIPAAARKEGGHPAKRTFQALRIAVNDELNVLEKALNDSIKILKPGGRILVITFHSLEDRIAKNIFKSMENPCICPPQIPICMCGKKKEVKIITRKPIIATKNEMELNSRSKSAKLRVAERVSSKR